MIRSLLLTLLLLSSNSLLFGQDTWVRVYGGSGEEGVVAVGTTAAGDVIAVGGFSSNNYDFKGMSIGVWGYDVFIMKTSPQGDLRWKVAFGGSADERVTDAVINQDGSTLILGYTFSIDGDLIGAVERERGDIFIAKLDGNGKKLWTRTIGGTGQDVAYSISRCSDGGYVVTGYSMSDDGDFSESNGPHEYYFLFVAKIDANGQLEWNRTFAQSSGPGSAQGVGVSGAPDGSVFVTGYFDSNVGLFEQVNKGYSDAFVIKLDSNGSLIWTKTFGGSSWENGTSVVPMSDNGCVVVGSTNSNDFDFYELDKGQGDIFAIRLDSAGRVIWKKTYGGSWSDQPAEAIASGNGFIMTGSTSSPNGNFKSAKRFGAKTAGYDCFVMRVSSEGDCAWTSVLGGDAGADFGNSLCTDSDGEIVIGGATYSVDGIFSDYLVRGYDAFLVKLDSTGNLYTSSDCEITVLQQPSSAAVASCKPHAFTIQAATDPTLRYQWQRNAGNGFVNLSEGDLFTGVGTNKLVIKSASSSTVGLYRCVLRTSTCIDTSAVVELKVNQAIPASVPRGGLIGWWPFDCGTDDNSTNANHAIAQGAVPASDRQGSSNKAYSLDGVNDVISVNWSASLSQINVRNQFTFAAWVDNRDTTVFNLMNMQHPSDASAGWKLALAKNAFAWNVTPFRTVTSEAGRNCSPTMPQNTWRHIVFTYDGSARLYRLYVNGVLVCSDTASVNIPATESGKLFFGYSALGARQYSKGSLDDVGLWDRPLTESEIVRLYGDKPCSITIAEALPSASLAACQSHLITVNAAAAQPLSYQWQKFDGQRFTNLADGQAYSGTTTRTLAIGSMTSTTAGTFRCVLSTQTCSDTTQTAELTLLDNQTPGYVPKVGLVGWWPFDCGADDYSSSSNNGVVTGATVAADHEGASNKAYSFDGVDDLVSVDWSSSLDQIGDRNAFTFAAWVNNRDASGFTLMNMQHASDTAIGWKVHTSTNSVSWFVSPTRNVTSEAGRTCSPSIPANEWRHIVFAYDGATRQYRAYVNGMLVCSDTASVNIPSTKDGKLYFGYSKLGASQYSNGVLDDVGLWSRSLTESEIERLYGSACAGGKRRYPLDSMRLAGNASLGSTSIALTPSITHTTGAAWLPKKHVVGNGIDVRFRFRMLRGSDNDLHDGGPDGADGIALVIQNALPTAIGSPGDGIGYHNIPSGLAVEFDMYLNPAFGDPTANHIAVQVGDGQVLRPWHTVPYLKGIVSSGLPSFKADGTVYSARVLIQGQKLTVFCDTTGELSTPLLTVDSLDLSSVLKLGVDGSAFIGITSATGFAQQQHELLEFSVEDCDNPVDVAEDQPVDGNALGRVVPVPARQTARLELLQATDNDAPCRIIDARGVVVASTVVPAGNTVWQLPVVGLPAGSYTVNVQSANNVVTLPLLLIP